MKKNSRGTSIIEAMVVLLIVVTGITGVYSFMDASQDLANSTGNRIEAIQIARDGLEGMTNIRDTNWILFGADRANCWNTLNYDSSCVGNITTASDIQISANQGIRLSKNASGQFFIGIQSHMGLNNYSDAGYIARFQVQKDADGFYTQVGGSNFSPTFTREIRVNYLDTNGGAVDSNDEKMEVTSIVQWQDQGSSDVRRLEMNTLLSNWKE